jgi:hypothetical protein
MSPISSKKRVPPSATLKSPCLSSVAPVNEPFLCPNNSLSIKFSDIAPQLIGKKNFVGS